MSWSIGFVVAAAVLLAPPAQAQSPREQLTQLVLQLQKAPGDKALRERIIKLGAEIKPPPAIPEEANRFLVRGNVFQKEARDASGYELAIGAYRDALRLAPWWGDAYFNLAVALESAGKLDEAIASLRFFLSSTASGGAEAREAQNRIYAIEAKAEMASKAAAATARAKAAAEQERRRPTTEGRWTVSGFMEFEVVRNGEKFSVIAGTMQGQLGLWRATDVVADRQRVRFKIEQLACPQCKGTYDLSLSPSGNELTGTILNSRGVEPMPSGGVTRLR